MKRSKKGAKSEPQGISDSTVDRVIKIFDVKPTKKYRTSNGALINVKKEVRNRLNLIKTRFRSPDDFDGWAPPAKVRNVLKEQHKKIFDAMDVLRTLSDQDLKNTELSKTHHLIKRLLCEVADIHPGLSHGLIGYDVVSFDSNFSMAFSSLEKVEQCYHVALYRAKASVKGRGKSKPENVYAELLLGSLCMLYKDITGQVPIASLHKDTGTARGKIIQFLDYILRELSYPYEATHWALEKKLRKLKSHEIYGQIWEDCKK